MPYCTQCGKPVAEQDRFCGTCGARQASGAASAGQRISSDFMSGISARNASLFCYIPWVGWLAAVIVLASPRFKANTPENNETRFHAFQGLYLFVTWLIVDWVIAPMYSFGRMGMGRGFPGNPIGVVLHLTILAGWIVMLIKTSKGERFRLPILGELAERSVNERRT